MNIRILLLTFLPLLLASCGSNDKTTEEAITNHIPATKLETFINGFTDNNKNWDSNQVIQDKANEKFKAMVTEGLKTGLIDDYALQLAEVNEYQKGKYSVMLRGNYKRTLIKPVSSVYNAQFDVIGLIDAKLVPLLKEKDFYTVHGRFTKFMGSDYAQYVHTMAYTPQVGMYKNVNEVVPQLGIILMEVDTLIPARSL